MNRLETYNPGREAVGKISDKGHAAFCSWSGGKDCALALYRAMKAGAQPAALLTMLREDGTRSRSHGLPVSLLQRQAAALGVPLVVRPASWNDYEAVFTSALKELRTEGIEWGLFGDIDMEDHRAWNERVCATARMRACLPLWKTPRRELLSKFLAAGFQATIVMARDGILDRRFLGQTLTADLIQEFKELGIDPSGELGEYHTVVTDGPNFSFPLKLRMGSQYLQDGCWFQEVSADENPGRA